MKIGVTGPKGRVGSQLVKMGCEPIDVSITSEVALKEANLDQYDVIINCAAKTNVDACEKVTPNSKYFMSAMQVNMWGVEYLRRNFKNRLIHISTDYVFDGKSGPYKETHKRNPVNDYGFTKFGGEVVLETQEQWEKQPIKETIIARTTGLYGSGNDFASHILECLKANQQIQMSDELRGNHTYIPHLCEVLLQLSDFGLPQPIFTIHVASLDLMTKYEFANKLAKEFGLPRELILPVKNDQIEKWVAPRPTKGGLQMTKALQYALYIYDIDHGIKAYLKSELQKIKGSTP